MRQVAFEIRPPGSSRSNLSLTPITRRRPSSASPAPRAADSSMSGRPFCPTARLPCQGRIPSRAPGNMLRAPANATRSATCGWTIRPSRTPASAAVRSSTSVPTSTSTSSSIHRPSLRFRRRFRTRRSLDKPSRSTSTRSGASRVPTSRFRPSTSFSIATSIPLH